MKLPSKLLKKQEKSQKRVQRMFKGKLFSQKKRAVKHAVVSSSSDEGDVVYDNESNIA